MEVEYGNYMFVNGTQSSSSHYITDRAQSWVDELQLFCVVVSSIVTDDALAMRSKIEAWIEHECRRLDLGGNCLVRDMTGHFNTKFYALPDATRSTQGGDVEPFKVTLSTNSPTPNPSTSSPTVPSECHLRTMERDCRQDNSACDWFGATIGCKPASYCGFKTSTACLSRWKYCEWRGGECRSKHGLTRNT